MQALCSLEKKLKFKPASQESASHMRLTGSVVDQTKATQRARLVVTGEDPEMQRKRFIKEVQFSFSGYTWHMIAIILRRKTRRRQRRSARARSAANKRRQGSL